MGKRKLRWIKDKRHMEAHSAHLTGNIAIKIQNMCFWFLSCIWSIDRKNCTPHLFLCLFCFFLVFSVNPWFFGNDRKHASNQTARIDTHFPHYLIFCYKTVDMSCPRNSGEMTHQTIRAFSLKISPISSYSSSEQAVVFPYNFFVVWVEDLFNHSVTMLPSHKGQCVKINYPTCKTDKFQINQA